MGELGALLVESEKVKELQPVFNRKLRLKKKFVALLKDETPDGFHTLRMEVIESFSAIDFDNLFGVFKNKKSVKETLSYFAQKYSLCVKVLGMEKAPRACFEYKIGRCRGACIGKESVGKYNARFLIAFVENKQFRPWMYDGPIEIVEKDEREGMYESFLVDKWCLIGKKTSDHEYSLRHDVPFDLDSYKIMSSYLTYKKAEIRKVDTATLGLQAD